MGATIPKKEYLYIAIKYKEPEKRTIPKQNKIPEKVRSTSNILDRIPTTISARPWNIWYWIPVLKVSILSFIISANECAPKAPITTDNIQKINDVKVKKDADGWEYEVYIDSNREFARAMNVRPIPHTFLLDGNKNIVWQHTGYSPGDEEDLFDQIKKITNNK